MISSASPASSTASISNSSHKYPPQSSSTMTARGSSRHILREENAKLQRQVMGLSEGLARAEEVLRAQSEKEQAVRNSVMLLRREVRRIPFDESQLTNLLDVTIPKDSTYGGVHHAWASFVIHTDAAVSASFAACSNHTSLSTATASQGSSADTRICERSDVGVQSNLDPIFTSASDP